MSLSELLPEEGQPGNGRLADRLRLVISLMQVCMCVCVFLLMLLLVFESSIE